VPLRFFKRAPPPRAAPVPETTEQTTLAMPELLHWLETLQHPTILDFGPSLQENFSLFSRYGGQIEILDLLAQLGERATQPRPSTADEEIAQIVRARLERSEIKPTAQGGGFDLILTWDYFDYLTLRQIEAIFQALEPYRHPGTRTLVLLSYVGELPLVPRRLRVLAPDRLRWSADPPRKRPSPRHNEPDVGRLLRHTHVISSHLMRHGVRELVFEDLG
jgi:hypothetical protein